MKIFKSAVSICENMESYVSIGGGEPTLHPKFWTMLKYALSKDLGIWMATNGSKTEDSLALAKLSKSGVISVALSRDEYHSEIDEKVVKAFTKKELRLIGSNENYVDCREIRTVHHVINGGRCDFGEDECICEGIIVKPNGNIYYCGCSDSPLIGNVLKKGILPEYTEWLFEGTQCWKWIAKQKLDKELPQNMEGGIRL